MTSNQSVVNKMFKLAKDEYEGRIPSHEAEIRELKDKIVECQRLIENLQVEIADTQAFVDHCCRTYGFAEGSFKQSTYVACDNIPALFLTRDDAKYAQGKTKYEWSQDERLQGRDLSVYGHIETPRVRRS